MCKEIQDSLSEVNSTGYHLNQNILFLLLSAVVALLRILPTGSQTAKKPELLLCMTRATLGCPLCISTFLKLCKDVEKYRSHISIKGLYLFKPAQRDQTDRHRKIIRLQLSGFVNANGIPFSFSIDDSGQYGEKSCVVVHGEKQWANTRGSFFYS